jgi:hypothetical protein
MPTCDPDRPDTPGPEEMKELIASLSPAERAILKDPDFIAEDEADIIMSDRSFNENAPRKKRVWFAGSSARCEPVEDRVEPKGSQGLSQTRPDAAENRLLK